MRKKIKEENFNSLLDKWNSRIPLYLPSETGYLSRYSEDLKYDLDKVPVWGGIKEFLFPSRNLVAGETEKEISPVILFGVRNCDLRALSGVFDKIMLSEEPVDIVYEAFRNALTLVSVDCSIPAETCFCTSVGGSPYTADKKSGSDLNISRVKGGYIVEPFTGKGEKLLESAELEEVTSEEEKDYSDREKIARKTVDSNFKLDYEKDSIREKIEENSDEEYWDEKARTCMQCGGCNFSCPSCYCNVLNELSDKKRVMKALQWDSCQFPGYARVAGGATPRPHLWQGFRQRYFCKFVLMQEEFDMPGCTGCGRCIMTCPGKIDMRETISGLYE